MHDRLWVGLSCRQPEHIEELSDAKITHWADHRRTRCSIEILELLEVSYLWNPTQDDRASKPLSWYVMTLDFVRHALAGSGSRALVTCARGQHRGPSMAYAVLRAAYGLESMAAASAIALAWPAADLWYADDIDRKLDELT